MENTVPVKDLTVFVLYQLFLFCISHNEEVTLSGNLLLCKSRKCLVYFSLKSEKSHDFRS